MIVNKTVCGTYHKLELITLDLHNSFIFHCLKFLGFRTQIELIQNKTLYEFKIKVYFICVYSVV